MIQEILSEFECWSRRGRVGEIFPREVGIPRTVAMDEVDLVSYLMEHKGVDCYASVFANWQVRRRIVDTIFIDVDAHNGDDADEKFEKVVDKLSDLNVRAYKTGRGYHIYIDFDPVRIEHYGEVAREFIRKRGITDYVDMHVVGDIRRMARIPLTINSKTNSVMEVVSRDGYNDWLAEELIEMDEKMRDCVVERTTNYVVLQNLSISELPKCIREGVEILLETGELEHYYRVVIALFLLKLWGYEKTLKLFSMSSDYDEKVTKYQLNFLVRKKYKCYSCIKLKELGICRFNNLRDCVYYVAYNGWLENMFSEGGGDDK